LKSQKLGVGNHPSNPPPYVPRITQGFRGFGFRKRGASRNQRVAVESDRDSEPKKPSVSDSVNSDGKGRELTMRSRESVGIAGIAVEYGNSSNESTERE
jgi:hypothetical protein